MTKSPWKKTFSASRNCTQFFSTLNFSQVMAISIKYKLTLFFLIILQVEEKKVIYYHPIFTQLVHIMQVLCIELLSFSILNTFKKKNKKKYNFKLIFMSLNTIYFYFLSEIYSVFGLYLINKKIIVNKAPDNFFF